MEKVELGAKVAAIITAMVAVVVFAISVLDDQEARNRAYVDVWRKAAIQKAFHQVGDSTLSISSLLVKLKSLAWDEERDIGKDDLTEDEVRVLLVELVSAGILLQRSDDSYALRTNTELGTIIETRIKEGLERELKDIRSSLADMLTKTKGITTPSACQTDIAFGEHRVAIFQCDGNFVIYRRSDMKVLWAAGTN